MIYTVIKRALGKGGEIEIYLIDWVVAYEQL